MCDALDLLATGDGPLDAKANLQGGAWGQASMIHGSMLERSLGEPCPIGEVFRTKYAARAYNKTDGIRTEGGCY